MSITTWEVDKLPCLVKNPLVSYKPVITSVKEIPDSYRYSSSDLLGLLHLLVAQWEASEPTGNLCSS